MNRCGLCACWLLVACLLSVSSEARAERPTTAFYYGPWTGASAPTELPKLYGRVVVEPAAVKDLKVLQGCQAIAYVSVGEHAPGAQPSVDPAWVAGENGAWGSQVMDLSQAGYRKALLEHFVSLVDAGYGGVFLDTLDSYQLVSKDEATRARMRDGLVTLIAAMAGARPQASILINRGFELLPHIVQHVDAVVAESLFDRYRPGQGYSRVPKQDREWLLGKLREVARRGIEVIVIDYRPPAEQELARLTAKRIADLGFTPFVTDGGLQTAGVSTFSVVPRRVLLLDDAPAGSVSKDSESYRRLAPVLESLGLVTEYRSLHDALPTRPLLGSYQGVISFFARHPHRAGWGRFLRRQRAAGVPLVFFGHPGFSLDSPIAAHLGLAAVPTFRAQAGAIAVARRDALVGFEVEPPVHRFSASGLRVQRPHTAHLELRDAAGERTLAVASTDFGGFARSHFQTFAGAHGELGWVIDPFTFLEQALRVNPDVPRVDVSTRQGLRVMLSQVRSEGASHPSRVLSGRSNAAVLLALLEEVGMPFTVDVEGASREERQAATPLLASVHGAEARLRSGKTRPQGTRLRLWDVEPLYFETGAGLQVTMPVAPDLAFIGQAQESYPYRAATRTFELLEEPRRLRPAALDYHAYVVSSPAGHATLRELYAGLQAAGAYGMHVTEYAEVVRDFREAAMAKDLAGTYRFGGHGRALTLRLGAEAVEPDPGASAGVLTYGASGSSRYVTLAARPESRLALSSAPQRPHVVSCDRPLHGVEVEPQGGLRVRLEAPGYGPLRLLLAGWPPRARCRVAAGALVLESSATVDGALLIALQEVDVEELRVVCEEPLP